MLPYQGKDLKCLKPALPAALKIATMRPSVSEGVVMSEVRVLGLCGSLRKASSNLALLRYAMANTPAGFLSSSAEIGTLPFYSQTLPKNPPRYHLFETA